MVLDIAPLHIEGLDCFEDSVFSVAAHYKREFQLVFSHFFTFTYLPVDPKEPDLIGIRLSTGKRYIWDMLKEYCGMWITFAETENATDMLKKITEQLQIGQPTIIYIDTFSCPWHSHYRRWHSRHVCLVIGIDDDNLICIDPVTGQSQFKLPLTDFYNGFDKEYATFNMEDVENEVDYMPILRDSVEQISKSSMFRDFEEFQNDYKKRFNFDKEFENANINLWDVLFYRNLQYICGSRNLFCTYIKYINRETQNPQLLQIEADLLDVQSKWKILVSTLLKARRVGYSDKIKQKTFNTLDKIAEIEKLIFKNLQDIVKCDNLKDGHNQNKVVSELHFNEFNYIDLKQYFNNIAFNSTCSKECKADFTGTGLYFMSENAPSNNVISLGNLKVKFPDIIDNKGNNISCNNQKIVVPQDEYNGIIFLGASEWGNFIEDVQLNYSDGDCDRVKINFSDWYAIKPIFDDKIIWSGKIYNKVDGSISNDDCHIFILSRPILSTRKLSSIVLPECTNMHIFGITLCK